MARVAVKEFAKTSRAAAWSSATKPARAESATSTKMDTTPAKRRARATRTKFAAKGSMTARPGSFHIVATKASIAAGRSVARLDRAVSAERAKFARQESAVSAERAEVARNAKPTQTAIAVHPNGVILQSTTSTELFLVLEGAALLGLRTMKIPGLVAASAPLLGYFRDTALMGNASAKSRTQVVLVPKPATVPMLSNRYGDRHLALGSLYREELESDSRSARNLGATVPILIMAVQ